MYIINNIKKISKIINKLSKLKNNLGNTIKRKGIFQRELTELRHKIFRMDVKIFDDPFAIM